MIENRETKDLEPEDRELAAWQQQWSSVAQPLPEIHRKIKRQHFRFVVENVLAAVGLVGGLTFAAWVLWTDPTRLGISSAVGLIVFLIATAAYRLWAQRGTWRPETQSTRAFVELWHKRMLARIRVLRIAYLLIPGWLLFTAALAVFNWTAIAPEVHTHPKDVLELLISCAIMLPIIFVWLAWYRRRKLAELNEAKRILDEMDETNA